MEKETSLGRGIRITDAQAQLDASCKRLLSEKILLAWIMKSCLEEYKDCTLEEITEKYIESTPDIDTWPVDADEITPTRIQSVGQEDKALHEHTVYYDIRFIATAPSTGEPIRLIINLESQNNFSDGYPLLKRAIYYCSRLVSSQSGIEFTGAQYGKIKKVYSIWLCLDPPKNYRNSITRYRMTEENLVGAVKEPRERYDLMTVVLLCLGGPDDENYNGILKLLSVLLSNEVKYTEKQHILRQDFDLAMTQTMELEVQNMCNLGEGIWERGVEKGMEKGMEKGLTRGRAEGRAEGRTEGRAEGLLDSIRNLMDSLNLTIDQAMAALKIPEAQQPRYRELLREQ